MPFDPDAVIWSTPETERGGTPLLVLLHGYGSHEGDLFGLAPYLPLEYVVASVRAPEAGPMGGWQWYPLPSGPDARGLSHAALLDAATDAFATWLRSVRGSATTVVLLGFSQGGSIALQTLRRHPDVVDAVVVLSTFVSPEPDPGDPALAARRPPVFWGHGAADELIEPERAAQLGAWLAEHSDLTARSYEGLGHSVSEAELADVVAFLRDRLPSG